VIGTLIVPRPAGGRLARWVDRIVTGAFRQATSAITDYQRRDRVLARQAAAMLLAQLGSTPPAMTMKAAASTTEMARPRDPAAAATPRPGQPAGLAGRLSGDDAAQATGCPDGGLQHEVGKAAPQHDPLGRAWAQLSGAAAVR
jgi:hypothetical protein